MSLCSFNNMEIAHYALRLGISDILGLEYDKSAGEPESFTYIRMQISRVSTQGYAVFVKKYKEMHVFVLDDSTGLLTCSFFASDVGFKVGDYLKVKGKLVLHKGVIQIKLAQRPSVLDAAAEIHWAAAVDLYKTGFYSKTLTPHCLPTKYLKRTHAKYTETHIIKVIEYLELNHSKTTCFGELSEIFEDITNNELLETVLHLISIHFFVVPPGTEEVCEATLEITDQAFSPKELILNKLKREKKAIHLHDLFFEINRKLQLEYYNAHVALNALLKSDQVYQSDKNFYSLI